MFILTVEGKEDRGAYSVTNESGDKILYLFEEEDDAARFASVRRRTRLSRDAYN